MSFRDLHHRGAPFVLPNAWDVPSALAFIADGFTAVGTTSFGVSSSQGHRDGGRATRGANAALATALAPLNCFVSVDVEDGYSDDPQVVAEYVSSLSVAGINIEDSTDERLIDPQHAADKIAAIKKRAPETFINARVDTYWLHQQANTRTTIDRALKYIDAGADGVFVPLANDRNELTEIVANIPRPVNTLPVPGVSLSELGEIGVARVSTGSVPYSAGLYAAAQAARSVRDGLPLPPSTPYPDLQARLVDYEKVSGTA
jgi:2-methylisocitrate lyase-like PEP mutase family enzyme